MKALFRVPYNHTLPRWPDADGIDQIQSAGWTHEVTSQTTEAEVLIEAPADVMADIKANSGWEYVRDVER